MSDERSSFPCNQLYDASSSRIARLIGLHNTRPKLSLLSEILQCVIMLPSASSTSASSLEQGKHPQR